MKSIQAGILHRHAKGEIINIYKVTQSTDNDDGLK